MPADQHSDPLPALGTADAPEVAGTAIGRYHLLQKIGEGGMGEVWLAEQKEPVRRRVALKVVKAGMNTREVMARFESERQALALMDHPAIAKVLDAGSTLEGLPYFVMEYVAGVPITTYCDNHRLSTRERLELFVRVCEGVQHAHQKAIIHRDLKPSNILVTEVDGRPAPKIIDFGVAKALSQRLTADTMLTRAGTMVGTPEYMSPEQALSSGEDIDTRSDVYSLGIIFYELLAGAPPIELHKVALTEFLRRLREEDPPKPSTKISSADAVSSFDVAHKRQTEAPTLVRQMRGDLDAIALKALEKDRSRRYGSPSEFAADIGRYLRNEAVLAIPPSVAYRARKLARRYRVAFVTATAFLLVLIAATVISTWEAVRTRRAEAKARQESAIAQAVNNFVQNDLLGQAAAYYQTKPDPNMTVRTALDRAAGNIQGKFARQPEVEAAVRDSIGRTFDRLGLLPQAEKQLAPALELSRRALGPDNPQTLEIMMSLAWLKAEEGKYVEAERLSREALEGNRRVLGPGNKETLNAMNDLAIVYLDEAKYAQAESLLTEAVEIGRRRLGPEDQVTLRSMSNLADVYEHDGKYAQAEALGLETFQIDRRVRGPEHPSTLLDIGNLAAVYSDEGKYPEAEAFSRQAVDLERRVLGPEHPDTLHNMKGLGWLLFQDGKYAEAEALLIQTLQSYRRLYGLEHGITLDCTDTLGAVYTADGKYAQAEALSSQGLAIARRALGPQHPVTLGFLLDSAFLHQQEGKYALAESRASEGVAGARHTFGPENPATLDWTNDLALTELSQKKFAEAESVARAALELDKKVQPDDWQRFRAESLLGASLAGEKKYSEAEPLLVEGYQGMLDRKTRMGAPDLHHLNMAHRWLVQSYQAWGKPKEAAEWARK